MEIRKIAELAVEIPDCGRSMKKGARDI